MDGYGLGTTDRDGDGDDDDDDDDDDPRRASSISSILLSPPKITPNTIAHATTSTNSNSDAHFRFAFGPRFDSSTRMDDDGGGTIGRATPTTVAGTVDSPTSSIGARDESSSIVLRR